MSTPQPPPAQARNRILLPGIWVQGGYLSVLVTQRCDGKVEFAPNISGAPAFMVAQRELVEALLRWGRT